ncbi:MAG: 4Fe-4S binding protein, partial [Firmicutes bacterium]|nr:4Fe-4S binding protein [Bacillota bacterium]
MSLMKIGKDLVRTLFKVPPTSSYPRGGLRLPDTSRGGVGIDEEKCTLCELCMRRCPSGAMVTDRKQERILIDRMRCIACGECVEECPFGAL